MYNLLTGWFGQLFGLIGHTGGIVLFIGFRVRVPDKIVWHAPVVLCLLAGWFDLLDGWCRLLVGCFLICWMV